MAGKEIQTTKYGNHQLYVVGKLKQLDKGRKILAALHRANISREKTKVEANADGDFQLFSFLASSLIEQSRWWIEGFYDRQKRTEERRRRWIFWR